MRYCIVIMYLRTTTRTNRDGSKVSYLQLAENRWNSEKKRSETKVVCTLGRTDGKGADKLKQLVASIRRQASLEELADMEDWEFLDSWEHGAFHALQQLWEKYGLRRILERAVREEGRRVPFERAVFAMVANRCLAPTSKLCCYEEWLPKAVYFPEGWELELHQLYGAMDLLARHKESIEEELYWKLGDLMNLDVDLIFYDTTSVYFEVDGTGLGEDDMRRYGKSKDGRGDRPQVVVGMAVTRDGMPVKSWVFPGNTPDVNTIEQVKEELRGWRLNRCIFVTDAGMVSEDNLSRLSAGGSRYITAMPCRRGTEVVTEVLSRPGRYRKVADNLQVKEVWVGDGERRRRYVVCLNPVEARRQARHREEVLAELEEELAGMEGHPQKACRLLSSRRYGKYLRKLKSGGVRISMKKVHEQERRDGTWVLRTNDETLTAEDLALSYKQLMRVEECWRRMKSGLRIRPMQHYTETRIRAHVYLCVLALLLERLAEKAVGDTWRNIRATLQEQKVGQLLAPHGQVFQVTKPTQQMRKMYAAMEIDPPQSILAVEQTPSKS